MPIIYKTVSNDYHNLLSLGIPAEVIGQANISEAFYKDLFIELRQPMNYLLQYPLRIDAPWQLQALTGQMDGIDLGSRQRDNHGATLSHYAALSGNPEALQRVADNQPELLTQKDYFGKTITHYAALSGNSESLNKALSLSETPRSFVISTKFETTKIRTLLSALNDNFTLTQVMRPKRITPDLNEEIARKLSRNLAIEKATQQFLVLAFCFHQKASPIFGLMTPDTLFEIFKRLVPNEVPEERVRSACNRIIDTASPEGRLLNDKQKAVSEILNAFAQGKLTPNRGNPFHKIGLMERNDSKIKILNDLKAIIEIEHGSVDALKERVTDYCNNKKEAIDHQRNKTHTFFSPNHKTTTRKMVDEIFIALEISKANIAAPAPHRPA